MSPKQISRRKMDESQKKFRRKMLSFVRRHAITSTQSRGSKFPRNQELENRLVPSRGMNLKSRPSSNIPSALAAVVQYFFPPDAR